MKALQGQYRIGALCATFGVSRSGYHRWRTAEASARTREDALLSQTLSTLHAQSHGTYGRPRLCAALRRAGRRHSPKRIARLMRTLGLRGVQRGGFRPQTTEEAEGNRGGWRTGEQAAATPSSACPIGCSAPRHRARTTSSGWPI